jgi:hypothetical protein
MSETGSVMTVVIGVEEAVIHGEEVGVIEILTVVMAEALIDVVRDIQGHRVDATHEIEAHSEALQGNQIPMFPVAEGDRDETTGRDRLYPNPDPPLLCGQTRCLVHRLVAGSVPSPDRAPRLLAGDLDRQIDERTHTEAVAVGEEEEVQTVRPVEDHSFLQRAPARVLQDLPNEELSRTLSVYLLRPGLDDLVAILVPYPDHHLDRLAAHPVGEYLAAERGLIQLPRQTLRRTPWAYVPGVVNVG